METPVFGDQRTKARHHHWLYYVRYGAIATVVIIVVGLLLLLTSPKAESAFEDSYTNPGGCLHATAYDPDEGAVFHQDTILNRTVLTVTPANKQGTSDYPVLAFYADYQDGGWTLSPVTSKVFESVVGSPLCVANPTIRQAK